MLTTQTAIILSANYTKLEQPSPEHCEELFIRLASWLTKPGEVGEILALYRLKSFSLDYKAKLKSSH
jgi:hypothetical protein